MKLTLNVGCGNRTFDEYPVGYKCINYDERSGLSKVDVVGDVRKLDFPDNYFENILASDIIEHFKISETVSILKEWKRVLKVGGIIEFRMPNLRAICKKYIDGVHDAKMASWLLYGGQDYSGNFHYVGFDKASFGAECKAAGLVITSYSEVGFNMIVKCRRNSA